MASLNSTGVHLESLSHNERIEYNDKLYKELLPTFRMHIHIDIMHTPLISEKLLTSQMEKIRRKDENDGAQAGSACLLEHLYKTADWFNCLIRAMEDESKKLHEFIPLFKKIKGAVDEDWLRKHPKVTGSRLPERRRCADAIRSPPSIPDKEFDLKAYDDLGMQKDVACEDSTHSTSRKLTTPTDTSQVLVPPLDAGNSSAATYVDGMSISPMRGSHIIGIKRASASTGVEMKSLHHDQRRVYSEKLYKKLLPEFKQRITVADFIDIPIISDVLTISDQQEIEQEDKHKGQQAGAAYLLEILERKSDWFNRIIMAMDHEECKLSDFISTFRKIKDEVDREWLAKYPDTAACSLSEDRPCAPVSVALPPGIPESDFNLELSASSTRTDGAQKDPLTTRNTLQVIVPPLDAGNSSAAIYVDGMPINPKSGSLITGIESRHTGDVLPREPLLSDRKNHPGLKKALSFDPAKDFERDFVRKELEHFPGFSSDEKEQQIMQQLEPYRRKTGTYVIWYWSLAKRPAICVVTGEEIIRTFIVHKSSSKDRPLFFINKESKKLSSLKAIVQHHIEKNIVYNREGKTVTVHLKTPLQRHTGRN